MAEIDKRYRRQLIENFDLDLPYVDLSFVDNWPIIKKCILIFVISALVIPFLPPLHSSYDIKWTIPTSLKEYYGQIKNVFYLFVIVLVLVIVRDVLSNIRTFIDRRFGYKKTGVFEVRAIGNLLTKKIVFLNNTHFFILNQKDYGFGEIKEGQIVEIERTATHKFMDYQITK